MTTRSGSGVRIDDDYLLGDEEIVESLRAGEPWNRNRDLKDIAGWVDFRYESGEGVGLLRSRAAIFPSHANSYPFPLPKESGGRRSLLYADPYDEAIYRAVVGRVAGRIDFGLNDGVESYRLRSIYPTWRYRNFRYGDTSRRRRAHAFAGSDTFGALVKIDVKEYYPSIDLDHLALTLISEFGCSDGSVRQIVDLLRDWQENWSVRGVPVGPEASGLLGNAMLAPLDRALMGEGIGFSRFTDDVTLYLGPNQEWEAVHEMVVDVLGSLGLELNEKKTVYVTDPLEARLHSGDDAILDRLASLLKEDPKVGSEQVRWLFDIEIERPKPSWRRIRFALKVFTNRADPHGLNAVYNDGRLWSVTPGHCGDYLARMIESGHCDLEWLIEQATTKPTSGTAATRYHQLLALRSEGLLPVSLGDHLREFALSTPGMWLPVRVAAADLLAKTKKWHPGEALAAAREAGSVHLQRAFVLSLRHGGTPKANELAKMRTYEACLPALRYLQNMRSYVT